MDIFPASRIPKHIQDLFRLIYRPTSGASNRPFGLSDAFKEKGYRITTEPGTLSSVLKWVSDAEVAFILYLAVEVPFMHVFYQN